MKTQQQKNACVVLLLATLSVATTTGQYAHPVRRVGPTKIATISKNAAVVSVNSNGTVRRERLRPSRKKARAVIAFAETPGYSKPGTAGYYCEGIAKLYAKKWSYDIFTGLVPNESDAPKAWDGQALYSWLKVPVIRTLLDEYEYVLNLDNDACIIDMNFDFMELTKPNVDCTSDAESFKKKPDGKDFWDLLDTSTFQSFPFGKDLEERFLWGSIGALGPMMNAGALLFRSTDSSRKFVDEIWEARHRPEFQGPGPWVQLQEQAAVNLLLFQSNQLYVQRSCMVDSKDFSLCWHPNIRKGLVDPPMPVGKTRTTPFIVHLNGWFYKPARPTVSRHLYCHVNPDDCNDLLIAVKHVACQVTGECADFDEWQYRFTNASLIEPAIEASMTEVHDLASAAAHRL